MKIYLKNQRAMRLTNGYFIGFGIQWTKYDDYQRIHRRKLCITLFNIDLWFESEKAITEIYGIRNPDQAGKNIIEEISEDCDIIYPFQKEPK